MTSTSTAPSALADEIRPKILLPLVLLAAVVAAPVDIVTSLQSSSVVNAASLLSSMGASTVHVSFQMSMRRGVRKVSSRCELVFPI